MVQSRVSVSEKLLPSWEIVAFTTSRFTMIILRIWSIAESRNVTTVAEDSEVESDDVDPPPPPQAIAATAKIPNAKNTNLFNPDVFTVPHLEISCEVTVTVGR